MAYGGTRLWTGKVVTPQCQFQRLKLSNFSPEKLYSLLQQCLPQRCALCAGASAGEIICPACAVHLPRLGPACPVCALPAPEGLTCPRCRHHPPPWTRAHAAFIYAFPVDRLVQALKYRGELALAGWFGRTLADVLRADAELPDSVVAVPLAPPRQRERGFNQAREIARVTAHHLHLPCIDSLARLRSTTPQAALPWEARAANVRGSFACTRDVRGARLALVDDVMTTGATLRAAALALRDAGAARVDIWVVARTL
jgi:ComF family protein